MVSANVDAYHIRVRGHIGMTSQMYSCTLLNKDIENPPAIRIRHRIIRARVISYEMVWATARKAPIRAYLELDAHPDPRIV